MVSLADYIKEIPPVTRFFTIISLGVCLAHALSIIKLDDLIFNLSIVEDIFSKKWPIIRNSSLVASVNATLELLLQSYRFLTAFMVPSGLLEGHPFEAILDIYFFYNFANHLESKRGKFKGNFADCLWFTLTTGTMIVLITLAYNFFDRSHFPRHHQMMLSCVTYLWSRSSKNSMINFLGIVPIKAYYLPLFNLFFKLLFSYSSFLDTFIGIVGGYLYQCIQSGTPPIFNLHPGYDKSISTDKSGRRVGVNQMSFDQTDAEDYIPDSIFDKGYLKAPIWLYRFLNYPIGFTKSSTAFEETRSSSSAKYNPTRGKSTSVQWFNDSETVFKGKGHRLGS